MIKGKGETVKRAKNEEVNGQGMSKSGKGVPRPHAGFKSPLGIAICPALFVRHGDLSIFF